MDFTTRDPANLSLDILKNAWRGAKANVPAMLREGMQGVEDWGERTGATAAGKGVVEAIGPSEPWEVAALGLGPAAKLGKTALKATGAATATMAGMEDAEAATGMRRVFYDLLRRNGGDVDQAKRMLQAQMSGMSQTDRAQATKVLKADLPPAVVQREMMTNPGANVYEVLAKLREQTLMKPEDAFKVGDVLVPVAGDTTRAGVNVKQAGIPLKKPVELQGGPDYGRTGTYGWASEPIAATSKQANFNKAEDLVRGQGEVKGVHVAMAPEGANFAKHTPDLWRQMLASGPQIDPRHMSMFDADVIRQINTIPGGPDSNKVKALREWRGVQDPGLDALLDANPEARKALMAVAAKPGWQHVGFPDIDELYGAALDPGLRTGDVGGAIVRTSPGASLVPGQAGHRTYSMDLPVQHMGRLETPLPPEMVFGDVMSQFSPKKRAQALGSLRSAHHARPVDQQFIDQASMFNEARLRALRGQ